MQDETNFGNAGHSGQSPLTCTDFDRLLADALDGVMADQELEDFKAHAEACADCGPLFTQAQAGMNWMKSLVEAEPPVRLVHNILAKTSMMPTAQPSSGVVGSASSSWAWLGAASAWIRPVMGPVMATMRQPRLAMTAAMAFFSLSMMLNLSGVKLKDLRYLDLRPSALTTTASVGYHETTAKVVKYYENIRLVYELESRMKALKDASSENRDEAPKQQPKSRPDDNSSQDKQNKNQNEEQQYVSEKSQIIMAMLRMDGADLNGLVQKAMQNDLLADLNDNRRFS